MQRITWYTLVVVALVSPIAGQIPAPQPKIREIATIQGVAAQEAVLLPNGQVVIYAADDSIYAYDLASKRSTLVTRGFDGELAISRKGDRIAFDHYLTESKFEVIWSIPINPTTGAAAGPPQRVSMSAGGTPSFSPDGMLIAFVPYQKPDGDEVAVVPVTGGTERVLAKRKDGGISWTSWSEDGKSIFFVVGPGGTDSPRSVERVPVAGGPSEKLISFSGRIKGLVGGQIAFYYPNDVAPLDGRIAYRTTSGASGEITVPTFPSRRGVIIAKFATPLWLWAKSTTPSEGPPASTIYELDMRPIVQGVVKR